MRAHQDLVELRDGDLAFSVEETRSLLAGFGVGWTSRAGSGSPAQRGMGGRVADGCALDPGFA